MPPSAPLPPTPRSLIVVTKMKAGSLAKQFQNYTARLKAANIFSRVDLLVCHLPAMKKCRIVSTWINAFLSTSSKRGEKFQGSSTF